MATLQDRIALVTGSTSGIGRGIATHFASIGASVMIHGPDEADAHRIAAGLRDAGADADAVGGDLTDPENCRRVVRTVVERHGGLDVLVNNAASTARGSLEEASVDFWDTMMAVNLRAPFICLQEAVKSMKARGGGSIVNIGSVNAYIGAPKLGPYSVSKGGLMTLSEIGLSCMSESSI